jgi:DNA ligase (NAD+)
MRTIKNYKRIKKKTQTKKQKLKGLKLKSHNKNMSGGMKDYKTGYIEILKQLEYYNRIKEQSPFKAKIYKEAIVEIKNLDVELSSANDIKDLPGIGKAITEKLTEYIETGKVKNLELLIKNYGNEDYETQKIKQEKKDVFLQIHGIGDAAAEKLIDLGITTIEELKARKNEEILGKGKKKLKLLNAVQQKGLEYYEEILEKIPREEIEEYKITLQKLFNEATNNNIDDNKFEIVGSYRRGKQQSGDIDIIITSKVDDKTCFNKFLDLLNEQGIIKVFLSKGEKKSMVISKLNNESTARRLDFLYAPPDEYAFAILYFTGSKDFNTSMRHVALKNGLTLNEHGFHTMKNKIKGDKIISPKFNTEADIFNHLNMKYKEPHERLNESSIVIIDTIKETDNEVKETDNEVKETDNEVNEMDNEVNEMDDMNKDFEKLAVIVEEKTSKKSSLKTIKNKEPTIKNETLKKPPKKLKDKITKDNIEKFKLEGIDVIKFLSESELTDMLKETNQTYYQETETPLLSDNQYDILREYVLKNYPKNKTALDQHADVKVDKNKVKLPYEMWSMDKIKADTKELNKFKQKYKGPYVISCKLDGVSALYTTEGDTPKLYTRGDGKYGQTIDHLIPYLKLPTDKNITLRGEIIIKENLFKEKYGSIYANSRNFVSGLINKKTLTKEHKDILKDIDFVGYEVIHPENLKPSVQLNNIETMDGMCVKFIPNISSVELTNEYLSEKLVDWRTNYEYTIDGVICIDDNVYERQSKNPDHAFAFKMVLSDQSAEAKVLNVLWTASKDGFLKPRVQIEEVSIGGVKINYATGFNAKFIEDNKIGLGAVIKIIRSGDVIPKIQEIITPAETALMPKEKYIWNKTRVDIILENIEEDETVKQKNIAGFFKAIEVEGLGEKNITKIIKVGGDSITKIIRMSINDLMKVEGFKEKMATKIYNSIQKQIKEKKLAIIAGASNIFGRGFGEKRISIILKEEPNIITEETSTNEKINKIKNIDGMAVKTATLFVEKIPEFKQFMIDANLVYKLTETEASKQTSPKTDLPLSDKLILLSDIKGKKLLCEKIEELGGKISTTITKHVNLLIVGSLDVETTKMKKANEYKIKIISHEEFEKKYL